MRTINKAIVVVIIMVCFVALTVSPRDVLPAVRNVHSVEYTVPMFAPEPDDAILEMDTSLLAAVAMAEDRSAPGAIMWVVKNRARLWHQGSIWKAVTFGESFGTRKVWVEGQMPEWRPIDLNWPMTTLRIHFENIALHILMGRMMDPTGGATHFHLVDTWNPPWAPPIEKRKIIGSHYFYKAIVPEETNAGS